MIQKKIIITEEQFKKLLEFEGKIYDFRLHRFPSDNFSLYEKGLIEEGIFKTYDINFVIKHFCHYLDFANDYGKFANNPSQYNGFITKVYSENNLNYLELVVTEKESILQKVDNTLKLCGYYKAFCEEYCRGYVQLGYEKIHEDTIKLNTDKIYHVTSRDYKPKIQRMGLVPKSKNKNTYHLERVYFFTKDYGEEGFLNIAKELIGNNTAFGYIVYEIDINKLNDVKFHYDVNTENGIYTTDNIPPEAIKIKYEYKNNNI